MSIAEMVMARAGREPNASAIVSDSREVLSYRELGRLVEHARRELAALTGQLETVALVMRNDALAVSRLLACELLDASCVLLAAELDQKEQERVAQLGAAGLLLDDNRVRKIALDTDSSRRSVTASVCQLTSGSSGPSRLAARSREGVKQEVEEVRRRLALEGADRVVCVSSIAHSYALVGGLLASLAAGATVVFASNREIRSGLNFRPTVLFGLPSTYVQLVEGGFEEELSDLRLPLSAGAPLPGKTFGAFFDRYGIAIRQDYGTTETGTIALDTGSEARPETVGQPLGHLEVRIFADEIRVRGEAVAASYRTAEGVLPALDGNGWYRTGDSGRLEDGSLYVGKRIRPVLQVDGLSINPEEVEQAIGRMPGVDEVIVINASTDGRRRALKAVVAAPSLNAESVGQWCREHLPLEQVPAIFDVRKQLPRSPAGKVLHKELL